MSIWRRLVRFFRGSRCTAIPWSAIQEPERSQIAALIDKASRTRPAFVDQYWFGPRSGGHQPSPLPPGTVLRPPPSGTAIRSRHNYTPTWEPSRRDPPQGGSGTIPVERKIILP